MDNDLNTLAGETSSVSGMTSFDAAETCDYTTGGVEGVTVSTEGHAYWYTVNHDKAMPSKEDYGIVSLKSPDYGLLIKGTLETVDSDEGRKRLTTYLDTLPYPHFRVMPNSPGFIVKIEQDGTMTKGRFVGREFRSS
jgi:hypothetical protein